MAETVLPSIRKSSEAPIRLLTLTFQGHAHQAHCEFPSTHATIPSFYIASSDSDQPELYYSCFRMSFLFLLAFLLAGIVTHPHCDLLSARPNVICEGSKASQSCNQSQQLLLSEPTFTCTSHVRSVTNFLYF